MKKSYPIQHDVLLARAELDNSVPACLPISLDEPLGETIFFSEILRMRNLEQFKQKVDSLQIRLFRPPLLIDCWPEGNDKPSYDYANLLLSCCALLLSSFGVDFSIAMAKQTIE